jgi:hypothetical protein
MQTYTTKSKGNLQTSNMHKTMKQNTHTLHFRQENSCVTYAQTSHAHLTFMGPCIVIIILIYNEMQLYTPPTAHSTPVPTLPR